MVWFRVDDGFTDGPKMLALRGRRGWERALALWVLAGSWCAKHLTDGAVPAIIVRQFGTKSAAEALVAAGLWVATDDGFRFHDWSDYQETKSDIEARRARDRQKKRKTRGLSPPVSPGDNPGESRRESMGVSQNSPGTEGIGREGEGVKGGAGGGTSPTGVQLPPAPVVIGPSGPVPLVVAAPEHAATAQAVWAWLTGKDPMDPPPCPAGRKRLPANLDAITALCAAGWTRGRFRDYVANLAAAVDAGTMRLPIGGKVDDPWGRVALTGWAEKIEAEAERALERTPTPPALVDRAVPDDGHEPAPGLSPEDIADLTRGLL